MHLLIQLTMFSCSLGLSMFPFVWAFGYGRAKNMYSLSIGPFCLCYNTDSLAIFGLEAIIEDITE